MRNRIVTLRARYVPLHCFGVVALDAFTPLVKIPGPRLRTGVTVEPKLFENFESGRETASVVKTDSVQQCVGSGAADTEQRNRAKQDAHRVCCVGLDG